MPRLLVVEDEPGLQRSLERGLRAEGYDVLIAADGSRVTKLAAAYALDAVLLDLMLPGRDGLGVLRDLRGAGFEHPVLVITACDAVSDRVAGLDGGADDYLIKPFSFAELLARLRALLRRTRAPRGSVLRVLDLRLDLLDRRASRAGREIELTRRQFELLAFLMRHSQEIVTREMIAAQVWREPTATWTNVIEVQINGLRKKIERLDQPPILHTIRGEGYLLGKRP